MDRQVVRDAIMVQTGENRERAREIIEGINWRGLYTAVDPDMDEF